MPQTIIIPRLDMAFGDPVTVQFGDKSVIGELTGEVRLAGKPDYFLIKFNTYDLPLRLRGTDQTTSIKFPAF